jgi:hypothetical protein
VHAKGQANRSGSTACAFRCARHERDLDGLAAMLDSGCHIDLGVVRRPLSAVSVSLTVKETVTTLDNIGSDVLLEDHVPWFGRSRTIVCDRGYTHGSLQKVFS